MRNVRLQIFKHFPFRDFLTLLTGKIFPQAKSEAFKKLQEKEIKLNIIFRNGRSPVISGTRVSFNVPFQDTEINLRLDLNGSDVLVFNQVIIQESYKDALEIYKKWFGGLPKTIVDAGANIGLASLYFAKTCPQSSILAVEPDHNNVNSIRSHIAMNKLTSIEVRPGALWPENRSLSVVNDFRDKLSWSLRVEEREQGGIMSLTPMDATRYFGQPVDFFKIDIEGGEAQLFKRGLPMDWLNAVKMIAIEVHEEYIDHSVINQILSNHGFRIQNSGELTIGVNSHFLKQVTL